MKRLVPLVLAFFSLAGVAFAEITLSPELSVSPSVDFRIGFLLYSPGEAMWYHTERAEAIAATKLGTVSVGGRYLYGKSGRESFDGKLRYGSADFEFSRDFYAVRFGFGAFSVPNELTVLSGKPRFVLENGDGFFVSFGGDADFSLFGADWSVSADALFSRADFGRGDMYYFYGRPDNFSLFGGKAHLSAPLGFELSTLGGFLSFDISTNENLPIGEAKASLASFFLAKRVELPFGDFFSVKPFAGYAYLCASGEGQTTSQNQTYSFFPYKYAGGSIDENMHFLSGGTSLDFQKGGFSFSLDFIYLFCFKNVASADYDYQYKKSIFFDGSSGAGELDLPDAVGCHVFAGNADVSYRFSAHKQVAPTVRLSKMLAAVLLNKSVKDYFSSKDSSYSTVSESSKSDSMRSIFSAKNVKKALLSGTSISVKLEL